MGCQHCPHFSTRLRKAKHCDVASSPDAKEVVRQLSGVLNIQEADKNVSRFELRAGRSVGRPEPVVVVIVVIDDRYIPVGEAF
jgi:glutamate racemase